MKKKFLRILSLLLVLVSLTSLAPAVRADNLNPGQILINYYGARERKAVMVDGDGTVYAPLSWLTYYCGLKESYEDGVYTYHHPDQAKERNFAKRIFIRPSTREITVGIYFSKKSLSITDRVFGNYYPVIYEEFSTMVEQDGEIWVPLTELLAIMEVEASFGEDGALYMQPVTMTLWRALYEHEDEIEDLLFNAEEDVVGNDFVTGGGYAVSTVMDWRVDRLDIIGSSGRINDYEEIFKDYLMDDEAYLKAFGNDSDPYREYIHEFAEGEEEVEWLFDFIDLLSDDEGALAWAIQYASKYKMDGTGGINAYGKTVQGLMSVYVYLDICYNHIDDHMLMLDSVYGYEKSMEGKPSYKAAQTVIGIYSPEVSSTKELIKEGVRDTANDLIGGKIKESTMSTLGPWYIAIECTKFIAYEEVEYISDCSMMGLVDNTVSYSYKIYGKRLKTGKFNCDQVDDIRLCLMMSLVGSRHAYKTYWKNGKKEEIEQIDAILKDLYLAGMFRDHDGADSYRNLKKAYEAGISKLDVSSNAPEVVAEIALLAASFREEQMTYDGFQWASGDSDGDGVDEFGVMYYTTDSGAESYLAEFDINDDAITSGIFNTGEYDPKLKYANMNLTRHIIAGEPKEIISELDAYLTERDGFLFSEVADVDSDGDSDWVYCIYGVKNRWEQHNQDPEYLYLYDSNITILVAEQDEDGVHIQTSCLTGMAMEFDPEGDFSDIVSNLYYTVDGRYLDINGHIYRYEPYKGYQFYDFATDDAGQDYSIESFLAGDIAVLEGTGYGLEYPYANMPNVACVTRDGEDIEITFAEDGATIESLRVYHRSGSLPITDGLYTDMTIHELWNQLPNSSEMWEPYPVYGFNDVEWYETSCYWKNGINGEIYFVVFALPLEGDGVLYITFDLIENGSDDLIN